jgi:hypothetical protein
MSDLVSPPAGRLRRIGWFDVRLIAGVLLILLSVAIGAKVMADAGRTEPVWALKRTLPAGATLQPDDLEARPVRIDGGAGPYLAADRPPTGFVLSRAVGTGELLPRSALAPPGERQERRLVTVPVERFHFPAGLRAGEVVDVYSFPSGAGPPGQATRAPQFAEVAQRIVAGVVVDSVDSAAGQLGASGTHAGVSLSVRTEDVDEVVAAAHSGAIDLVRVPGGTP